MVSMIFTRAIIYDHDNIYFFILGQTMLRNINAKLVKMVMSPR